MGKHLDKDLLNKLAEDREQLENLVIEYLIERHMQVSNDEINEKYGADLKGIDFARIRYHAHMRGMHRSLEEMRAKREGDNYKPIRGPGII